MDTKAYFDAHTLGPRTRVLVTGGSGFIGTNFIDRLRTLDVSIVNLDIKPPYKAAHRSLWHPCDILEAEPLGRCFSDFKPTHVVHLAARTDTVSDRLEDYEANTEGTARVLEAIKRTPGIGRVIITSTQFVHKPGPLPKHDTDYDPHTTYGQSKVITEQLTREAELPCDWTLTRPTNIWGPWHPRYPDEFWKVLRKGWYFHPGGKDAIRSYGYVGNVVHQIMKVITAPAPLVHEKVYYLGDEPVPLSRWVQGFSKAITGKPARVVPGPFVRGLALFGDAVTRAGLSFPITSSRFRSMTQDYPTPMKPTLETFGPPPYSIEQGIEQTVSWLKTQGFFAGCETSRFYVTEPKSVA